MWLGALRSDMGDADAGADPEAAAGFEARLHVDGVTFDADDAALLRAVAREGSLNAAAAALGRSYSRAHSRVTALETALGPLVERRRGGPGGGGSRLTPLARAVLARFARLRAALAETAAVEATVLEGTVRERDGPLAVVETPAGAVRAVLDGAADRVQVTVRADAVTLHDPATVPPADATSARNRIEGTVATVEPAVPDAGGVDGDGAEDGSASLALVRVDAGTGPRLAALVTPESRGRLDLTPGRSVVATWKATATRATPA